MIYVAVDLDEGIEIAESSAGQELLVQENDSIVQGGDSIVEPQEGMEFESEDAAKIFYDEYARQIGFVMRVMSCRRSERDGRILARRLGCNKEGYCVSIRGKFGNVRKPRPSTREGCKAMIHVKFDKSGKWVITKFVKEHNHPLVVAPREARQSMMAFYMKGLMMKQVTRPYGELVKLGFTSSSLKANKLERKGQENSRINYGTTE
ncbi:protein FAR1-RELATED SEQUENCE 5 isoform X3 [Manihot esculenta]|uniref:protein FAR1-RELATED SEQUENCE 5 isoform X3 n=1 Tax=Manihot esculenta TaxID=3983 RepID=UPI000B5D8FB3|nr:protein FAR1-RELATED SEQUENCE 5 isoform X3 [Manihot esculenta]